MTIERLCPPDPYTGSPFCCANSFSETCGRAPMCWITSAGERAQAAGVFISCAARQPEQKAGGEQGYLMFISVMI